MPTRIPITIVDCRCPICGSDRTRSKVCDNNNIWWYICDDRLDRDHGIVVLPSGRHWNVDEHNERFYFTEDGLLETPEGVMRISHQTRG